MKIAVVVRAFTRGGAERQAAVTAAELARRGHDVEVLAFHPGSAYAEVLADAPAPVPVHVLGGGRAGTPIALLGHLVRRRPDVLLAYLAGPNLASLVGRLPGTGRPLVVWGIRSTTLRGADETRLGRAVGRLEPWGSRAAHLAVANSTAGRDDAVARGFRVPIAVVPNGIDVDRWAPRPDLRAEGRAQLGAGEDELVLVRVGRVHPMKDLPTMLRAVAAARTPALLAVVGSGDPDYERSMQALADELGVAARVRWLGDVDEPERWYAAADVAVSSSAYGEGFPNVIGEALASGVPCIGTDVGDTAWLIGDAGTVVPAEDAPALAAAIDELAALGPERRAELGRRGRRRVVDDFSVPALGDRLESLLAARVDR